MACEALVRMEEKEGMVRAQESLFIRTMAASRSVISVVGKGVVWVGEEGRIVMLVAEWREETAARCSCRAKWAEVSAG